MNVHDVLLNMQSNHLIFEFNHCNHFDVFKAFMFFLKNLLDLRSISNFIFIEFVDFFDRFTSFARNSDQSKKSILRKILGFRSKNSFFSSFNVITKKLISSESLNKSRISTNIVMIDAVAFDKLNFRKNKITDVKCYFMMMFKIDDVLTIYRVQNDLKFLSIEINEMNEIFIKKFSLKKNQIKFHFDFHNLLQAFDSIAAKNLLFHRFYNYKIDLVDDFHTMRN